jgi:hypothetical protein
MSLHRVGPTAVLSALCLSFGCASAEEIPDEPVRPGAFGGTSGTGGSDAEGGTSSAGTGGASSSGGAGGTSASGGTGANGGSGGIASGGSGGIASGGTTGSGGTGGASTGGTGGSATGGSGGSATGGAGGTGGVVGTSAFFDDFESGTDGWVAVPADGWSIVSDGTNVYKQSTLDTLFRVSAAGVVDWTDQVVEAKIKVLGFQGSGSSYYAAVYGRFKDMDNHYYMSIDSYGKIKIRKKSFGNNTSITSEAPVVAALNTWYTFKLEITGSSLKAYVDGTPVLVATDPDVASGGIAVGTKNASAEFDDVRVSVP